MRARRFVVMGAGEVGYHLARSLSADGHRVTVIDLDAARTARVDENLDAATVIGNGAYPPVLDQAGVPGCDLFLAVSSSDEANLAASLLAKELGAQRCVVRLGSAEEAITHRRLMQRLFGADLLLSTQLLTTTQVLNHIRGHSTVAVEHYASGKVQLRKVHIHDDSLLARQTLREIALPENTLVVALFRGDELIIPHGDDRAEPGDDALLLGGETAVAEAERMVTRKPAVLGTVVIAGCGATGEAVAQALEPLDVRVKIIDSDRERCRQLAALFPRFQVIHGDATDLSLLRAERVAQAGVFVALSGHDESNLLACLMAQELGMNPQLALVQRVEERRLWVRLGLEHILSPRVLAYERIREYIGSGFSANIVSLKHGAAQVLERRLYPASPAAGVTLADINPPRGLVIGTVVRGEKVFVPRGSDRLEVGDLVLLFVREEELDTVRLLFPGRDEDATP